jgi:peptide/nickel transport system substrate-binding protein
MGVVRRIAAAALLLAAMATGPIRAAELVVSQISETRDLTSIDPFRSLDFTIPASLIFDRLIHRDAQGRLQPALATQWEQLAPTRWRFAIRSGVRFHDGSELTAADVAATLNYGLDPRNQSGFRLQLAPLERAEVRDERTVILVTATPTGLLPDIIAAAPVLQAAQIAGEDRSFRTRPIGSGPYRLESWRSGERVTKVRNPAYWGEAAAFDRVIVKAVPEAATRVADLLSGGAQIAADIPPGLAPRIQQARGVRMIREPGIRTAYLSFLFRPPFDDARVRRAVYHAIDRRAYVQAVLAGSAAPATGMVPERFGGYVPAFPLSDYDPARARALLAEVGIATPLAVDLDVPPAEITGAQVLQAQLRRAGIEVRINPHESIGAVLDPRRLAASPRGRMWTITALDNHIFDTIRPFTAFYGERSFLAGAPGYRPDARFAALIGAYAAGASPAERQRLARAVTDVAYEEMPVVYLAYPDQFIGAADAIEVAPQGLGHLDFGAIRPR